MNCADCGQPTLPPGEKKRPNEYDHASGCPSGPPIVERVFESSHIRRGRLAVDPTWFVTWPDGSRQRFTRKRDALAEIERRSALTFEHGIEVFEHDGEEDGMCARCGSSIAPIEPWATDEDQRPIYVCLSTEPWCKANPLPGRAHVPRAQGTWPRSAQETKR